ncbi:hypothetical protein GGH92_003718 [Coemansia sp. RSA 2673]|nr:hypothetical protein GGH92_003718 [Coemansia sp. RSA 2673]
MLSNQPLAPILVPGMTSIPTPENTPTDETAPPIPNVGTKPFVVEARYKQDTYKCSFGCSFVALDDIVMLNHHETAHGMDVSELRPRPAAS